MIQGKFVIKIEPGGNKEQGKGKTYGIDLAEQVLIRGADGQAVSSKVSISGMKIRDCEKQAQHHPEQQVPAKKGFSEMSPSSAAQA